MKKQILIGLVAALLGLSPVAKAQSFTPAQIQEIDQEIHSYLLKNPKVLVEVSMELQKQETEEQKKQAIAGVMQNQSLLFADHSSPTLGNAQGKVNVIEFFDYQCPHCKDMATIMKTLQTKNPNVKFIYKELPIFGADSEFAAKAALAAQKQNKFKELHELLLQTRDHLNNQKILELAKQAGIDTTKLQQDMNDPAYSLELQQTKELAGKLGIRGTPFFVVSPYPLATIEQPGIIPGAADEKGLQALITSYSKA